MRKGTAYPPSGYDELDNMHMIPRSEHFRITPSPGAVTDRYGKVLLIFLVILFLDFYDTIIELVSEYQLYLNLFHGCFH